MSLPKTLLNLANKFANRFFLLEDLRQIRERIGSEKQRSRLFWRSIKSPATAEDWIPLHRFLDREISYVLVDIGANVGAYTSEFLENFKVKRAYCFEPVPDTFEQLKARLAQHDNVEPINKGIGSKASDMPFNLYDSNTLNSLHQYSEALIRSGERPRPVSTVNVRIETLDAIDIADGRIFLKIDTQGMEADTLRGCEPILDRVDAALMEVSFVSEYEDVPPSFAHICGQLARHDLYPIHFQSYGNSTSIYAVERDVLFVRRELLARVFSSSIDPQTSATQSHYCAWKVGSVGFLPSLVLGKDLFGAGKDSLSLVRSRFSDVALLRAGYAPDTRRHAG